MNEKGTTLIEVMASILILSISAAVLYGGFSTIINFIQESNSIKNASNEMMNVIEGKSESKNVTYDSKNVIYYLKTADGDNIKVNSNLGTFKTNYSDDVVLKSFVSKKNKVLGDDEEYKLMLERVNLLNDTRKSEEKEFESGAAIWSYCYVPMNVFGSIGEYSEFPSNLLPTNMRGEKYYIRLLYPWDYASQRQGSQDERAHMGGPLIYLSKYNIMYNDEINCTSGNKYCNPFLDTVNFIYDYTANEGEGVWYYHEGSNYQVDASTMGGTFPLILGGKADGFYLNGNSPVFDNFDELLKHIKNPVNRWKVLNLKEEYDGTNIDDCWQAVH